MGKTAYGRALRAKMRPSQGSSSQATRLPSTQNAVEGALISRSADHSRPSTESRKGRAAGRLSDVDWIHGSSARVTKIDTTLARHSANPAIDKELSYGRSKLTSPLRQAPGRRHFTFALPKTREGCQSCPAPWHILRGIVACAVQVRRERIRRRHSRKRRA